MIWEALRLSMESLINLLSSRPAVAQAMAGKQDLPLDKLGAGTILRIMDLQESYFWFQGFR